MKTFAGLLREPGARAMTMAGLVGRIPMSMVTLGITLLVVDRTGSYALAGAVTGAQTLAMAFFAPFGSRLADRHGQTRILPLLVVAHSTCLVLLVLAVSGDWPKPTWVALAALAGACLPMMGSMVRARWTDLIDDPARRSSAFALESSADETALILGPVLASALAVALSPAAAVLAAVGLLLVGGLGLAVQRRTAPAPEPPRKREQGHPIRQPGMPVMVLMMAFIGGLFGAFQVSTVAFGESTDPGWIGGLLAAFSVGSLVSGLFLATRKREWSLIRQLRIAVVTLTVTLVPLVFVGTPLLFAGVAVLAGLSVSVVMIGAFALVERLVPESRLTESLSSVTAAVSLGMSGGSWLGGVAIDASGPSLGLTLCAIFAAAAGVVFWSRAHSLRNLERRADAEEGGSASQVGEQDSAQVALAEARDDHHDQLARVLRPLGDLEGGPQRGA